MTRFLPLFLALILTACTASDAPAASSLSGTSWVMQSMMGAPTPNGPRAPTLRFASDTQVGGRSGCNTWGGSYQLNGNVIKFGQLHTTLMACEHGMEVEAQFHAMMKRVRTVTVNGEALIFSDDSGVEVARFARTTNQ